MSSDREDTFLIAVTVTGQPTRMAARHEAYTALTRLIGFGIESWTDAGIDHVDNNDDGEAVWTHPGRGVEAQRALVAMGYAPETDMAVGPHPGVWVIRNGDVHDGDVMCYECTRCGESADHPAVLAEVPCQDMSKWEHAHLWIDDTGLLDGESNVIKCIADCGLTIVDGQPVGQVDGEHVGAPPGYDEPSDD